MKIQRLILGVATLLLPFGASAAPSASLSFGTTAVRLSNEFTGAVGALGEATNSQASLGVSSAGRNRRGEVRFLIAGGFVDAANAKGEILHTGGIFLRAGGTRVDLGNFIIDTTGTPVLTGLVRVNDSVVGRLPLFSVTLPNLTLPLQPGRRLQLSGASLTLTSQAAQALNGAFNVNLFSAGVPIGSAQINATVAGSRRQ